MKKAVVLGTVTELVGAFYGCSNLTSVSIASAAKKTYAGTAFAECGKLQSITIPNGVYWLDRTFDKCTCLEKVYLPTSVESIAGPGGCFSYCYKLKDIYFAGSKAQWNGIMENYSKRVEDKLSQATIHFARPDYTGLVKESGRWVYLENDKASSKTGIAKRVDGKSGWYYVEKGVYKTNKTGITKRIDGKGGWYYVENGVYKTKTGLTKRIDGKGGWFYVEKGVYKTNRTGLTKRVDGKGGWFYVEKGVYKTNRTGLTKRVDGKGGWFYVRKGKIDTTKTGLVRRIDGKGGLFLVKKGVYQSKFTGTYKDSATGKTYNIVKGVVK